jgi:hypothetical protein
MPLFLSFNILEAVYEIVVKAYDLTEAPFQIRKNSTVV